MLYDYELEKVLRERIDIFKIYWKLNKLNKFELEEILEYYIPIIRIKIILGEPIIGKYTNINSFSFKKLIEN